MWPGKPLCRLCERPAADGGHQAAELDKEKFSEWCLVYLGHTLADELKDNDLICCFCVWDARFLHENSEHERRDLCWWPKESMSKALFETYEVKQCWVPLKKLAEPKAVEETCEGTAVKGQKVNNGKLYKCIYCKKSFSIKRCLTIHIESKHRNIAIRCNFFEKCANYFLSTKDRDEHIKKLHYQLKERPGCIFCSVYFTSRNALNGHMKNFHAGVFTKCKNVRCGKYFKSLTDLDLHFNMVHKALEDKKTFQCENCSYKGVSKRLISLHIQHVHFKIENRIKCKMCAKSFKNDINFKIHVKTIHKFKYCTACGVKFSLTAFSAHISQFQYCKRCGDSFQCYNLLKKHKIACSCVCELCSKSFPTRARMKYHINRHLSKIAVIPEQNAKFKCKFCGKYLTERSLKYHDMMHSDSRCTFECGHCTMKYFKKFSLVSHLANVHNLIEKNHPCNFCDTRFCSKSILNAHLKSHSKSTIQCSICQGYILSHRFSAHMICAHGIRRDL
ncbi:zinc finger protein 699-like [Neocloeon triangulifer]|uniref:zinc finger protein 699-like n=1 Tax=Neocloeon triangulifer TaxID=2078957 RepID=UPI00286EC5FA|nr:zinc finger protein 699-like [Neocloeon triangulifer]